MKYARIAIQMVVIMSFAIPALPQRALAQDYAVGPEQNNVYGKRELAQMLAPIALYPDSLISQILMASTYPVEVVEAERWLRRNRSLTGDALNGALQEMAWNPSVKLLCYFPDVLFAMSDKLDRTTRLGDAFLSQKNDVMATIQELRHKAIEQGNLLTTREQLVIIDGEIIRVQPSDPQVLYVPVFNPVYVYGPWWYPAYPPSYWYYPQSVAVTGGYIHFGSGIYLGIELSSYSWFDWHRHNIYVEARKVKKLHRFSGLHDSGRYVWKHDPRHRRRVAHRNIIVNENLKAKPPRWQSAGNKVNEYRSRKPEKEKITTIGRLKRRGWDVPSVRTQPKRSRSTLKQRGGDVSSVWTQPEKSRSTLKRRGRDVPSLRTQPERSRSTLKQRGGDVPHVKMQRKSYQKVQRLDSPIKGTGNGDFKYKASQRGDYSSQSDKTRGRESGRRGSLRGQLSYKGGHGR